MLSPSLNALQPLAKQAPQAAGEAGRDVTLQIHEYRLVEYVVDGLAFVTVAKDLGTRPLPCYCDFGFIVAFTGLPDANDRVTVAVLDTAERPVLTHTHPIHETDARCGRIEVRLDTVTFSEPGVYTVQAWLGESVVFTRRLTLARSCPP